MKYMEEVNVLVGELAEGVVNTLEKKGITLPIDQEDTIWMVLQNVLGEYFGYPDYRNYN